jgi:hypothetical protein
MIATSGRDDDRIVLLARRGGELAFVAKVRAGAAPDLIAEALNLDKLGAAARRAGARLPNVTHVTKFARRTMLVETVVPGAPVATLLAGDPRAFPQVFPLLVDWLEGWHKATVAPRRPRSDELEAYILGPARSLEPLLPDGVKYVEFLTERCASAKHLRVPFVAVHNDLTMFNVLLDGGRLGVVDWEAASGHGLPLTDFAYAAVDAVAAADRYADRLHAFTDSFASESRYSRLIAAAHLRFVSALDIPPEVAELCLHASWLQHAVNATRRPEADRDDSFVAIVAHLASTVTAWPPG